MKKIFLVLAMLAACVFFAQPAIAGDDDPVTTTATDTPSDTPTTDTPTEDTPTEDTPTGDTPTEEAPPAPETEVPPPAAGAEPPADTRGDSAVIAAPAANKKIVVCKFVSTPGGELDHVIIVDAPKGFLGVFPTIFADAQDSVAIRYAEPGEQAKDVAVSECDFTPPVDVCPDVPGNQPTGTDCSTAVEKKVVVCKYVGTPPGTPDHIIVVNESALGDGFLGVFPYAFGDAQDSIAIRYAVGNEQPGDEELVNCPTFPTEVTPEEPTADPATCDADGSLNLPDTEGVIYSVSPDESGPGDFVVTAAPASDDFVLNGETEFNITVEKQLSGSDCTSPDEDDNGLLPDTGGLPLWALLVAGPMVAAGVMLLKRRQLESDPTVIRRLR
ncbi:hypothetical protein [Aeromicrobium ginsengisoli]|uniref:hypothetical protein n=1 Tax=Aeromicrobium ginsengisoli TaxID=363867 RepID=UPI00165F6DF2|nr:hypothetical protein [Aeromicrobium ginsengisoli]